jgi:flavodoxin
MKALTAFFSAEGTTAAKAGRLAELTGSDLYEIKPANPYSPADIKWTNPLARCNREWIKKTSPELADKDANIGDYDVIYLAFPIWYFTAPLIILSFLESYDFSGKKIILFATSGGSEFGKKAQNIASSAKGAEVKEGLMLNGEITDEAILAAVSE